MPMILAIDQGTTGSRALLVDEEGVIRGEAYQPLPQIYPHSGWVEHDPLTIWDGVQTVIGKVMSSASPSDVAAIGITNQRETTLIWERATGAPIHNAIVWQCRRTTAMCERLKSDGLSDEVQRRTGLVIDPYFSATKIRWLLDHVPDAHRRAERGELAFGTIDSWLIYQLTGGAVHATDPTNASRTMLYNIHEQQWDDTLLTALRIPRALLPEVRHSTDCFGEVVSSTINHRHSWRCRRPASRTFRSSRLPRGRREKHLRDGVLCLAQHGRDGVPLAKRLADYDCLRRARQTHLRFGGQRVHRRRGRAMAAR